MDRFMHSKIEEETIYEIYRACRLCGAGAGYKMPIIQNVVDLDGDVPLTQKIRECVQIQVNQDDKMPPLICELCVDKVNDFYEFSEMCKQTNMRTRLRLGLPPQTLPRGAPNAGDCILGVTEPIYVNDDSNEPIIKHKQSKLQKSKSKKGPSVKVKIELSENRNRNSRSSKPTPEDSRRTTRGSITSPTNILALRNRSTKDQKTSEQPKKKTLEPLKSILKKDKSPKEEDSHVKSKSKRGRDKDTRSDLPVKRVKIEIAPVSKTRTSRSPPRSKNRAKSPEPSYVCQICKRRFPAKVSLANHMRTHSAGEHKSLRNKRNAPAEVTRPSRDRVPDRSQTKGKGRERNLKLLSDNFTCDTCGREYLTRHSLRKHEVTCNKKKKVEIDPELMSKVRPLQVRVARCDPLLGTEYTCLVSTIPQVFGLDKNCYYPYLTRNIKTEPKTGRDGMVRIEDEFTDVLDDANFIHWDSDSSSDISESMYEPFSKKKKVMSLSTLSLKTIFSSRYLGRARRKRRKIKTEDVPKDAQNKEIFDIIDSFDDVHDLERMNDTSFDQLFDNDYSQRLTDADLTEDGSNKEGTSNKDNGSTKEKNDEHEDSSELSDNKLNDSNFENIHKIIDVSEDTTGNKETDVSEDIVDSIGNKEKEITGNTNLPNAEDEVMEEVDNKTTHENNSSMDLEGTIEESDLGQASIENERIGNIDGKQVPNDVDKSTDSNHSTLININNDNEIIEELKDNLLNTDVDDLKENMESAEISKEEKMETEESQIGSKIDSSLELEETTQKPVISQDNLNNSESISNSLPTTDDTDLVEEETKEEKKELINCVPNIEECHTSELISESELLGVREFLKDPELSRDSVEFDEKYPELDGRELKEENRNRFKTEIERKDNIVNSEDNETGSSLKENQQNYAKTDLIPSDNETLKAESSQLSKDRRCNQEDSIDFNTRRESNNDILINYKEKVQSNHISTEDNENQEVFTDNDSVTEELSQNLDAMSETVTNKDLVTDFEANQADDIMRAVLNKVEDTKKKLEEAEDTEVDYISNLNGQKNYVLDESEMELEDQKLMDELDAQIGDDLMPRKINLDDFSEDF